MRIGGYESIAPVPPFPSGTPGFMDDLKTPDPRAPHWDTESAVPENRLSLAGDWQIQRSFPDPEELLETAYSAVERFARTHAPRAERTLQIICALDENLEREAFTIEVSSCGIRLFAADTEGMRRALYHLIDMARSENIPALKYQCVSRKFWLKNRISRCFFGPIKRPPFFRDELTDDIDYYPEAYLDRLAAEGINGIWLTIVWKEMAETGFFPVDPQREQRIAKLRQTVAKCRRYGIKVWVFCIEPASWSSGKRPPEGMEDMAGGECIGDIRSFCIASDNAKKYIRDTVYSIFRDTPHLGGMMLISLGERPTSCLSFVYGRKDGIQNCRSRCGLTNSRILDGVLSAIRQGITDAGSDAQVLSWLYNPFAAQIPDWWFSLPESLDSSKILAFNFESGCSKSQSGRVHSGGDYWLSCTGPSDRFGRMAAAAKGHCEFAAKLQVGCSHELATVPFMPVPGLLYDKYHAMYDIGVTHVIQCWYFGNYPGLMNRAAGMLASEEFKTDKQDFLRRLALPDWGEAYAGKIAQMWERFGDAYSNYPLDIQFQYYGPMHDGVVWPLHLKQLMRPLPRTWKPEQFPAGDAIGECMANHSLHDASVLTGLISSGWGSAVELLPELRQVFAGDPARMSDCDLYEALDILFHSGNRILNFYLLRKQLFHSPLGCHALLEEMRKIVRAEKEASARMIELCRRDSRLGYHSEAEVFKFYPEKLAWRIAELEKLEPEFDALAAADEESIRSLLAWEGTAFVTGETYAGKTFRWQAVLDGTDLKFTVGFDPLESTCTGESKVIYLMDPDGVKFPLSFSLTDSPEASGYLNGAAGVRVVEKEENSFDIFVPLSKFDHAREVFAGVARFWMDEKHNLVFDGTPDGEIMEHRLNLYGLFSAEKLKKLVLKNAGSR